MIGPYRLVVILNLRRVTSAVEQDKRLRALLTQSRGARFDVQLHPGRTTLPLDLLTELRATHGGSFRFECPEDPQLAARWAKAVGATTPR